MNEEQTVFKLGKMSRSHYLVGAGVILFFFSFAMLVSIVDPLESRTLMYAFYAFEAVLFAVIAYLIRLYFGYQKHTVIVKHEGLQFGAKETAPVVPWSDIRKLKKKSSYNRVYVLGRDDKLLGVIKLQLEGIDKLLQTVMNAMPQTDVLPASTGVTRRFKGSLASFFAWGLVLAGFGALTVFPWLSTGSPPLLGLILFLVFLILVPLFLKNEIRWVEFTDKHLVIKTLTSKKTYTRKRIPSVELLVPTSNNLEKSMNVVIYLGKRKTMEICTSNQDPFEVFWTCRRWLDTSDEIRIFLPKEED